MSVNVESSQQQSKALAFTPVVPTRDSTDLRLSDTQLSSHLPRFQYKTLPHGDSIRLVRVCSGHPEIRCEIITVLLSDLPFYEALSYCWGPPGQLISITCNDASFEVSSSLRNGLQQLYQYSKSSETPWFWIDQICINQEDGLERTQQVRLMHTIYRQSIRTVIWLPSDDETAIATKSLVLDMYDALKANADIDAKITYEERIIAETEILASVDLPSRDDERWQALDQLLESPWFNRVWIIQEVILSTHSPAMLCGTQFLTWSVFERVIRWVYHHPLEIGYLGRAHAVDRLGLIGEKEIWNDGTDEITWDIQGLLQLTYWFRATNPRDKIFALLGMCKDTRDLEKWPIELNPDYDRPLPEVFADVSRYCIRQTQTLNILHLIDGMSHTDNESFPSWVPRWDNPSTWTSTGTHTIWIYPDYKTIKDRHNDASKGLSPMIDDTTAPDVLRLLGMRVDVTAGCCGNFSYDDIFDSSGVRTKDMTDFQQNVVIMMESCSEHLSDMSTEELHRAFFLATTMGQTPEATDAVDEPLMHFEAYIGAQNHASKTETEVAHQTSNEPDPDRYACRLEVMINRRLFITTSGKIGLGPARTASKDVVVILFGGNVPYVLRPLGNGQWEFIGECYIHGLMKGEALQGDGASEEKYEWFELV
jgi:hypothetical protein